TLRDFVPEPPPLLIQGFDELPSRIRRPQFNLGSYYAKPDPEEVEPRVRETARPAQHDILAVLRRLDVRDLRVGDQTGRRCPAALKAVGGRLAEGDFCSVEDAPEYDFDPASDLAIQSFAWPLLLQAGGLVEMAGNRLQLTSAGRKALNRPASEVIRQVWQ